jgi:hypothetical protein
VPADEGRPEADLAATALAITQVFAEVIAGMRPLHHLAGRAAPAVYDGLARALPATMSPRPVAARRLRVTAPVIQEPAPGVAELSAIALVGTETQALALRLERVRGRWRCSAVETTISPRQALGHASQSRGKSA